MECVRWRRSRATEFSLSKPEDVQLTERVPCIYKLYGLFDYSRRTGPVLTEDDEFKVFSQVSLGQLPPAGIRVRLSRAHLLFLGMTLQNWTKRMLLTVLRKRDFRRTRAWTIARNMSTLEVARSRAADVEQYDRDLSEFAERFSAARRQTPP